MKIDLKHYFYFLKQQAGHVLLLMLVLSYYEFIEVIMMKRLPCYDYH